MRIERDIAYGALPVQRLDVFAPDRRGAAAVLMDFHAGAWRSGSRVGRAHLATGLVPRGVVWVPVDYGLAPEFAMEEIVDHCRQAVAWVSRHIADHGGDPERVHVSGNSAGGHLAATMLMDGWTSGYGLPPDAVKGVCGISGVYDLRVLVGAPPGGPNDELGMDIEVARRFSPHVELPTSPPDLIVAVGEPEQTTFTSQAHAFAARWTGAGLPLTMVEVPGAHHFAMGRQIADHRSTLHAELMTMMRCG